MFLLEDNLSAKAWSATNHNISTMPRASIPPWLKLLADEDHHVRLLRHALYENGIPERCKVIGVEIYVDFFLAHKA